MKQVEEVQTVHLLLTKETKTHNEKKQERIEIIEYPDKTT
jgi:hypothetical protein